jgi:hypothetical protein
MLLDYIQIMSYEHHGKFRGDACLRFQHLAGLLNISIHSSHVLKLEMFSIALTRIIRHRDGSNCPSNILIIDSSVLKAIRFSLG